MALPTGPKNPLAFALDLLRQASDSVSQGTVQRLGLQHQESLQQGQTAQAQALQQIEQLQGLRRQLGEGHPMAAEIDARLAQLQQGAVLPATEAGGFFAGLDPTAQLIGQAEGAAGDLARAREVSGARAERWSQILVDKDVDPNIRRRVAQQVIDNAGGLPEEFRDLPGYAEAVLQGLDDPSELSFDEIMDMDPLQRGQNLAALLDPETGKLPADAGRGWREYLKNNPGAVNEAEDYRLTRTRAQGELEQLGLRNDLLRGEKRIQDVDYDTAQANLENMRSEMLNRRVEIFEATGIALFSEEEATRVAGVLGYESPEALHEAGRAKWERLQTLEEQEVELGRINVELGGKQVRLAELQIGSEEYLAKYREEDRFFETVERTDELVRAAIANGDTPRVQRMIAALQTGGASDPELFAALQRSGITAEELQEALSQTVVNEAYRERSAELDAATLESSFDRLRFGDQVARADAIEALARTMSPEEIESYWNELDPETQRLFGESGMKAAQSRAATRLLVEKNEVNAPQIEIQLGLLETYATQSPDTPEERQAAELGLRAILSRLQVMGYYPEGETGRQQIEGVVALYQQAWADGADMFDQELAFKQAQVDYYKALADQAKKEGSQIQPEVYTALRQAAESAVQTIHSQAEGAGCTDELGAILNTEACSVFNLKKLYWEQQLTNLYSELSGIETPEAQVTAILDRVSAGNQTPEDTRTLEMLEALHGEAWMREQMGLPPLNAEPTGADPATPAQGRNLFSDIGNFVTTQNNRAAQNFREAKGAVVGAANYLTLPARPPVPAPQASGAGGASGVRPAGPSPAAPAPNQVLFEGVDVARALNDPDFEQLVRGKPQPDGSFLPLSPFERARAFSRLVFNSGVDAATLARLIGQERTVSR